MHADLLAGTVWEQGNNFINLHCGDDFYSLLIAVVLNLVEGVKVWNT